MTRRELERKLQEAEEKIEEYWERASARASRELRMYQEASELRKKVAELEAEKEELVKTTVTAIKEARLSLEKAEVQNECECDSELNITNIFIGGDN